VCVCVCTCQSETNIERDLSSCFHFLKFYFSFRFPPCWVISLSFPSHFSCPPSLPFSIPPSFFHHVHASLHPSSPLSLFAIAAFWWRKAEEEKEEEGSVFLHKSEEEIGSCFPHEMRWTTSPSSPLPIHVAQVRRHVFFWFVLAVCLVVCYFHLHSYTLFLPFFWLTLLLCLKI